METAALYEFIISKKLDNGIPFSKAKYNISSDSEE